MNRVATRIHIQNTRLFPKNAGAAAYRLTGIAARCDWVILTDGGTGRLDVCHRGDLSRQPRTIFLSLRSFFDAIPYFVAEILPKIEGPFVLVTGSEDITVPNQVDVRWRRFSEKERGLAREILRDRRLIHWFAENPDALEPKMSSLPVGYVIQPGDSETLEVAPADTPLSERPLKMLCAHRVRDGAQWEARRRVTELCESELGDLCTVVREELPLADFKRIVRSHPLVICAQGGGLDPSPKAWFCILNGSIPIIKSSALDDAYCQLPVAFVEDWRKDLLARERLVQWRRRLAPWYEDEALRAEVVHRLSIDFWWSQVMAKWEAR